MFPQLETAICGLGALSRRERKAILDRDDHTSQLRVYSEEKGWHLHPGHCGEGLEIGCRELHVHHIRPQHQGGKDVPENLLTVFSCLHVGRCPINRIK